MTPSRALILTLANTLFNPSRWGITNDLHCGRLPFHPLASGKSLHQSCLLALDLGPPWMPLSCLYCMSGKNHSRRRSRPPLRRNNPPLVTWTTVIVEVTSKSGGRTSGAWLVPIGGRIKVKYYLACSCWGRLHPNREPVGPCSR